MAGKKPISPEFKPLVKLALWPWLFGAQLIFVSIVTVALGSLLEVGPPQPERKILWQFLPALTGLVLGLMAHFKIDALQLSGKWVGLPGFLILVWQTTVWGWPETFATDNPFGLLMGCLVLSCMLYSLTLIALPHLYQRVKNQ